jgi:hypothetical protein
MCVMAYTETINLRVDAELVGMVDELTAFYGKQAADLGLSLGRSDAIRVIIRAAHRDMKDKLDGNG